MPRGLLIGNTRWHWAERTGSQWCFDHGPPDGGRLATALNQAGLGCCLKFLGAQISTKVPLCEALAPTGLAGKGSVQCFLKQKIQHYLTC